MNSTLYNTPLVNEHIAGGAQMTIFGGWNMPLQYEGILSEWERNRKTCSIFDCSHMGEFTVWGQARQCGLDRIVTQSIIDMPVKTCRYGAMLDAQGGVVDDLLVYRREKEEWMLVVNAVNIEKNAQHLKAHLTKDAQLTNISWLTAKLDLQGPLSRDVLSAMAPSVRALEYYTFDMAEVLGHKCLISRTGYTGELGYEIYCPWDEAVDLWRAFLKDSRVKPTGLGVRDVLRIEMCYPLYGHELTQESSPLESGLDKFICFDKDFLGRDALLKQKERGVKRSIGYVVSSSRRSPRAVHKIFNADGRVIGEITSGTFSPGLSAGVGIGFIEKSENMLEKEIVFGDDKSVSSGRFSGRPFYKGGSLKN